MKSKLFLIVFVAMIFLVGSISAAKQITTHDDDCEESSNAKICEGSLEVIPHRYYDNGFFGIGGKWKKIEKDDDDLKKCFLFCEYKIEGLPYDVEIEKDEIELEIEDHEFEIHLPSSEIISVEDNKAIFDISKGNMDAKVEYSFYADRVEKLIVVDSMTANNGFLYVEPYKRKGTYFKIREEAIAWDANGDDVKVYFELNEHNTKIRIDKDDLENVVFPLYIDPTLDVGSTITLGGEQEFDWVLVRSNGTINVNATDKFLNITASVNITVYGTINGNGRGEAGGGGKKSAGDGSGAAGSGLGPGGGGGTAAQEGKGGGGAGHVNAGGAGGNSGGSAGGTYGNNLLNQSFIGSGGGGGAQVEASDSGGSVGGGNGGTGGAAITLKAPVVIINGTVTSNGGGGGGTGGFAGNHGFGGGGGGSAGTIQIMAATLNLTDSTLTANGGGGSNGNCRGVGWAASGAGGASGGRIKLFYVDTFDNSTSTSSESAGAGGSTNINDGCTGTSGAAGGAGVYFVQQNSSISFDDFFPRVSLNTPADNTITNNQNIEFSCNSSDDKGIINTSLHFDGALNFTNASTNINLTLIVAEGIYDWTCSATDNANQQNFSTNRTLTIDLTAPLINVTSPIDQDFATVGENQTLNWSVIDALGNLDSCWFDYNTTNQTVTCSDNTTNFILEEGNTNLTFYANDSAGNLGSEFHSWNIVFSSNGSAVFNVNVTETSAQSFSTTFTTIPNLLTATANLNYDNQMFLSSVDCSGINCNVNNSIDIPLISAGETENKTFFWEISLFNGSDSFQVNTTSINQTISRIHLEECNATFTTQTLNFTAFDEQNLSRVSPFQFDGTFDFWTGTGTFKRNNSFSKNVTEMDLCLSPNVTMKIDAIIDYDESENLSLYTPRFYYFDNHSIDNTTLQHIQLYLLQSSASTSFILKVQDENLLPVADALIEVHRFFPGENTFKIVQIAKTDDNGKSIGFFVTETVDYKFIIKKNGEILLETGQQKVIPETSPFTLIFNTGADLGEPWVSQLDLEELNSSLIFNKDTGIVTYVYSDTSTNFTQGRLLVIRESLINSTANFVVCNVTSIVSSASLTCDTTNQTGFYIASGFITRGGEGLVEQINFNIEDFSSVVGFLGLFFGWFIILIAAFMFKFNEIAGIWAITITIFLVNLMGLIKFGGVFVTAIFGVAIILTWLIER